MTTPPEGPAAQRRDAFVERVDLGDGRAELRFAGRLDIATVAEMWAQARRHLRTKAREFRFDLSRVLAVDVAGATLLSRLRAQLAVAGTPVDVVGTGREVQAMLDLIGVPSEESLKGTPRTRGTLDQIGAATLDAVRQGRDVLAFIGDWALALVTALRSPRTVHWRDVPRIMERAGADAVPIVALINFLLGLILAFQAAVQLRQFGANIYVADLVGIAVVRELGPLMTAIIVAGRSGSAFAAEIGTMKVSEEIDALKTMRLSLQGFLVLPRVLALLAVVPLLTLLGDAIAIAGGLVVGITGLELTPQAYLSETQNALSLWDVFSGVLKSLFFALYLALVACQRGLVTRGGAEGVGRSTTSSVVTILFGLVLLDALFTVLFHVFGL